MDAVARRGARQSACQSPTWTLSILPSLLLPLALWRLSVRSQTAAQVGAGMTRALLSAQGQQNLKLPPLTEFVRELTLGDGDATIMSWVRRRSAHTTSLLQPAIACAAAESHIAELRRLKAGQRDVAPLVVQALEVLLRNSGVQREEILQLQAQFHDGGEAEAALSEAEAEEAQAAYEEEDALDDDDDDDGAGGSDPQPNRRAPAAAQVDAATAKAVKSSTTFRILSKIVDPMRTLLSAAKQLYLPKVGGETKIVCVPGRSSTIVVAVLPCSFCCQRRSIVGPVVHASQALPQLAPFTCAGRREPGHRLARGAHQAPRAQGRGADASVGVEGASSRAQAQLARGQCDEQGGHARCRH